MSTPIKIFFSALALYFIFHLTLWYGNYREAKVKTLIVDSMNESFSDEHDRINRYFLRINDQGEIALTRKHPSFKIIRAMAYNAGEVQ